MQQQSLLPENVYLGRNEGSPVVAGFGDQSELSCLPCSLIPVACQSVPDEVSNNFINTTTMKVIGFMVLLLLLHLCDEGHQEMYREVDDVFGARDI
ncbi:MAG: hypothetical protein KDI55_06540, partial [Anaerolineae bacterium]|nr:hypothetical protein [Anaerolineae bacterium]